jgi:ParB-like nuclease domain
MNKISKIEYVPIWKVKNNPNNPRLVKDDKFKKLVKSIQDFPEMLDKRPIIVNEDMIVLGGNMRLKACNEAGLKEVPIIVANWTEEQQRAFIIKDNLGYGEWDWDIIANEWDVEDLTEWGLDVWKAPAEIDYSILDGADESLDDLISDMADGVKKAIQIEFEAEHYEEAYELVKFWRERKAYVGGMIMEYLKSQKEKL